MTEQYEWPPEESNELLDALTRLRQRALVRRSGRVDAYLSYLCRVEAELDAFIQDLARALKKEHDE